MVSVYLLAHFFFDFLARLAFFFYCRHMLICLCVVVRSMMKRQACLCGCCTSGRINPIVGRLLSMRNGPSLLKRGNWFEWICGKRGNRLVSCLSIWVYFPGLRISFFSGFSYQTCSGKSEIRKPLLSQYVQRIMKLAVLLLLVHKKTHNHTHTKEITQPLYYKCK